MTTIPLLGDRFMTSCGMKHGSSHTSWYGGVSIYRGNFGKSVWTNFGPRVLSRFRYWDGRPNVVLTFHSNSENLEVAWDGACSPSSFSWVMKYVNENMTKTWITNHFDYYTKWIFTRKKLVKISIDNIWSIKYITSLWKQRWNSSQVLHVLRKGGFPFCIDWHEAVFLHP